MISEYNDDKTLKFLNTLRRSGVVDWGRGGEGGGKSYSNPGRVDTLTIKINLIIYWAWSVADSLLSISKLLLETANNTEALLDY